MKRVGKNILLMIIGGIIFSVVSVYAAVTISANNITLDSDKTDKTNVSDALDELYNSVGKCPSGQECYTTGTLATAQTACPSGKECYATGTLAAATTAYYARGTYTVSTFPKTSTVKSDAVFGKLIGNGLYGCYSNHCFSLNINDFNLLYNEFAGVMILDSSYISNSIHDSSISLEVIKKNLTTSFSYNNFELKKTNINNANCVFVKAYGQTCYFCPSSTNPSIKC